MNIRVTEDINSAIERALSEHISDSPNELGPNDCETLNQARVSYCADKSASLTPILMLKIARIDDSIEIEYTQTEISGKQIIFGRIKSINNTTLKILPLYGRAVSSQSHPHSLKEISFSDISRVTYFKLVG